MNEEELKQIVVQVLGIDESKITDDLERNTTEEWDSFNHLLLISEVEKASGLKIETKDIESIRTISDLKKILGMK